MTKRRRILFVLLAVTGVLLALGAALSSRVAGIVSTRAQQQISASVDADVQWQRVRLGILRTFPRASLRVDDVSVVGRGRFAGDTLLAVRNARVVMNAGSLYRSIRHGGAIEILDVEINGPAAHLIVLEDGTANWDLLADEAEPAADAPGINLDLRRLVVRDGSVAFENRRDHVVARIDGVDHRMRGSFGADRFRLAGSTDAAAVSVRANGVPYLSSVRTALRYDVDVDNGAGMITVEDAELKLNELALAVAGTVALGDALAVDIRFDAPGGDFAQFASLVPGLDDPRWRNANARGTLAGSGWVRGEWSDDAFPAFDAAFTIRDGRLHHSDMPLPVDRVNADLALRNPGGALDLTVVDLSRLDLMLGAHALAGRARLAAPVSDPLVDLAATGTVDLADVARTFPMQDVEDLRGRVAAELAAGFRMSDLDSGRYERVRADGTLSAGGIRYSSDAMPLPLELEDLRLVLSPASAELRSFIATLGTSDVSVTGELENLLGFALRGQELRGRTRVTSRRLDLDPWRSEDEANAIPVPARVDLRLEGSVAHLTVNELDLTNVRGALQIRDQRATLEDLRFGLFDGDVTLAGYYDTSAGGAPAFNVNVNARRIDAPAAFTGMTTVRALAPAARWARGRVSADVTLAGRLGEELTPIFNELDGRGAFEATDFALEGFPPLVGLANLVRIEALRNPALTDLRSTFSIQEGRLHISPFQVGVAGYSMTVSGSHGFDETMDYRLAFRVPRANLVGAVIDGFSAQATRVGLDLGAVDALDIVGVLGGTVGRPDVRVDLGQPGATAGALVRQEAERRIDALVDQGQAMADDARQRADEEAARRRADAERRAEAILAEARELADAARREGNAQADALVAQAGNPVARRAAVIAADRLRRETEQRADAILRDAEARAARITSEAAVAPDSITPP